VDETTAEEIRRDRLDDVLNNSLTRSAETNRNQISQAKRTGFWLFHQITKVPFLKLMVQRFYNLLYEYYAQVK
jgi:hypothetical protein